MSVSSEFKELVQSVTTPVQVQLLDPDTGSIKYTVLTSQNLLGDIPIVISSFRYGDYDIVVKKPNSIAKKEEDILIYSGLTKLDWSQNKSYKDKIGDLSGDGIIDDQDFYTLTNDTEYDIDGDGVLGLTDLIDLYMNW